MAEVSVFSLDNKSCDEVNYIHEGEGGYNTIHINAVYDLVNKKVSFWLIGIYWSVTLSFIDELSVFCFKGMVSVILLFCFEHKFF